MILSVANQMWGEAQLPLGVHQASSNDYVHIMEMENEKKKKTNKAENLSRVLLITD